MNNSRREFLKCLGALSVGTPLLLNGKNPQSFDSMNHYGVLYDSTKCIGCGKCEWACKKEHEIEHTSFDDHPIPEANETIRRPDENNLCVINKSNIEDLEHNIKYQCMHCLEPACVSACIVGAFTKDKNGTVVWDSDKCIGCRYCMVACPFQIPAFEYSKAIEPDIVKCDLCIDRTSQNKLPACIDICPQEAIIFGDRAELIQVAKKRIKNKPEKYFNHLYGEHEAGGTTWLYLSNIDVTKQLLPKLSTKTAPGVSESIQHGIFAYFIPPVAFYALLGGIMWISNRKDDKDKD